MKIIFLDIDGVLNSQQSFKRVWEKNGKKQASCFQAFDDDCVARLKQIILETGAKIVISSSWRKFHWDELLEYMTDWGIINSVIGKTTNLRPNRDSWDRGHEIREWLLTHLGIDRFIILDDDSDMCEFTETNLIKTNNKDGLQEHHMIQVINMLNDK